MTGSYLAGVARRTEPGRATLLPPVTPWGPEARPEPAQPVVARAAGTEAASPTASVNEASGRPRPGAEVSTLQPARRPPQDAAPALEAAAPSPSLAEPVPHPTAEETVGAVPAPPAIATSPETAELLRPPPREVGRAEVAATGNASRQEPRPRPRPAEPVSARRPPEAAGHARPATAPRTSAPPLRIESIEVVVERAEPAAAPVPPPVEPARRAASPRPAALARGFSSLLGLRQG